ncbi:MAG: hypothetical protein R3E12_01065 [Candidatus Eisenbacteria bacterium]
MRELSEPAARAEIINTSVWGTGTDQQYLLYLDEGRKYQADLVILAYYVGNITRNGISMRFISMTDGLATSRARTAGRSWSFQTCPCLVQRVHRG